jgi:alcohol dehydrogenase class IV
MGLHRGLCHVLGGTSGVGHGDVNSVLLSHVIRFNLDATAHQLAEAEVVIGAASASLAREDPEAAARATAERVSEWVSEMGLPQRQRDLAILEADLPGLRDWPCPVEPYRIVPDPTRTAPRSRLCSMRHGKSRK